jgi:hypothetical protein
MTIRRLKTYAGSQGYVYQYYFVGKRSVPDGPVVGSDEYIFDVTSDRKSTYAVSVFLPQRVADEWATLHKRTLSDSEKYAAVKMRLFRAFDDLEEMQLKGRELLIELQSMEEFLKGLGVD